MNVRVYNYESKELLSSFAMKGDVNGHEFATLEMIETEQRSHDILGVGILGKAEFGIKRLYHRGCLVTSMDPDATHVITGYHSCELRPGPKKEDTTPPNTTIDGADAGIKVGVVMYESGWILNTGKQCQSIFGTGSPAYLKSIGKRNIHSGSASSARKFKSIDSVVEYIVKNRRVLDYTVNEYGYAWSVEPTCVPFLQDFESALTRKKYEQYLLSKKNLQDLLDEINNQKSAAVPDDSNIPEEVNPTSIQDEILYRMMKQKIWNEAVSVFRRTGEIFQSEAGGMIYKLDDGAKIAVLEAEKDGLHPWHVIKNVYQEIGTVYSVLYVSDETAEWPEERRDRDGFQVAYCWNEDQKFADVGQIKTESANGGLVRVA